MIDFRDELEEFFDKYSWIFILFGALYFLGHLVYYLAKRFLYG
jgi:hypothetical protein